MKVLLINGSPRENGSTATALKEIEKVLQQEGVETELLQVGKEPIKSCTECMACLKTGGLCAFDGDIVNEIIKRVDTTDGFIFGSPVFYASPTGSILSVLDRVFYAAGNKFAGKPGAAVTAARRAGTTAALDVLQKYFPINGMPIVPTQYWPMVFGRRPGDAEHDLEGMQTMRVLGRNMAWMIKCFDIGKENGVPFPALEEQREWTHFIR